MNLSPQNKKIIKEELEFVTLNMKTSQNPDELLYYFSGFFGILKRVMNLEYSDELLFSFYVVEKAYHSILERMTHIKSGTNVIPLNQAFKAKLVEYAENLRDNFFNNQKRIKALQDIVVLAFWTTGNGFYLAQKGIIDLDFKEEVLLENVDDDITEE